MIIKWISGAEVRKFRPADSGHVILVVHVDKKYRRVSSWLAKIYI